MAAINKLEKGELTPAFSYGKVALIGTLIAITTSAIVIAIVFSMGREKEETKEKTIEIATSYIPDNYFFNAPKPPVEALPPTQEATVVVMEKPASNDNDNNQPPPSTTERPQPIKLTAEEMFIKEHFDAVKALQDQRRAAIQAKRGKAAKGWEEIQTIKTIEAFEDKKKAALESPKDKDFSSQEILKDESTFPVDLSRVVTADRSIPCLLREQINSQLEGRTTCLVERNVYGFHGRNILIPAGSVLMGQHGTLKRVGDERFNIGWARMLRPDGVHVSLTDAYSSDRIGATGIEGVVNNRRTEKYGGALLTSTVSAIAQASIATEGSNNTRIALESYGTDLGRVTAAMLQENINIKPYSIVPAGTRINVTPVTDIWLKPTDKGAMFAPIKNK